MFVLLDEGDEGLLGSEVGFLEMAEEEEFLFDVGGFEFGGVVVVEGFEGLLDGADLDEFVLDFGVYFFEDVFGEGVEFVHVVADHSGEFLSLLSQVHFFLF